MAFTPGAARLSGAGNNSDNVRRHNLATVLRLVHASTTLSRAELTRRTGLNRSTIAALVGELQELGLVIEQEPLQTGGVGRPSLVITAGSSHVAVAVNPEIDAVTLSVVGLGGRVLLRRRVDRPMPRPEDVVAIVSAELPSLLAEAGTDLRCIGIGLALPGLVRMSDGLVVLAPHLEWREEPLGEMLAEATRLPVSAANDASCGATAESLFGAGAGVHDLIYLNGGASGIGGGVLSEGRLLSGASGFAGEFGHTLVESHGRACHCGATGCLETEVSRSPLLDALGLPATEAEQLEETLVAAYERADRDRDLVDLVERQVGYLAVALRNAVNLFNPSLIVLGGFLGSLYRVAGAELDRTTRSSALPGARDDVSIVRSSLGRDILSVGAAELAFAQLLSDPAGTAD